MFWNKHSKLSEINKLLNTTMHLLLIEKESLNDAMKRNEWLIARDKIIEEISRLLKKEELYVK